MQRPARAEPAPLDRHRLGRYRALTKGWRWNGAERTLVRHYCFPTAIVAQAFTAYVLTLADARGTYPRLSVEQRTLTVHFSVPDDAAVEACFELAMEIDTY